MPVSILILTHNEAPDLAACLQSVAWSDDVFVFDSFSSDGTLEIAAKAGAKVEQREFDNHAGQLNAAIDRLPFKHPWLLVLDADERVSAGLAAELRVMDEHNGPEVAYRIRRREFVWGRQLKHGRTGRDHLRYFSWDSVRFEGGDQPRAMVDGAVGDLEAPLDHFPLVKGVAQWLARRDRRSTAEARRSKGGGIPWRALFRFASTVVFKRGFLDGRAGLSYACLQLIHDCTVNVKRVEMMIRSGDTPVATSD
jgi:glycosyltransferase involved in cell wall biosynthesis